MTRSRTLIGLCSALFVLASIVFAGDKPWLDFEHCDMCKNFMTNPDLVKGMKCETHNIATGFVSVTTVKPELLGALRDASAKCDELGKKLMTGEKANLCGSCEAMGMLMAKGAKLEEIPLENGSVMLLTSTDPIVIDEIHNWTDKTNEETKKMMPDQSMEEE